MGKTKKKNSGTADFGTDHAAYFSILWEYPKVCVNLQTDVR